MRDVIPAIRINRESDHRRINTCSSLPCIFKRTIYLSADVIVNPEMMIVEINVIQRNSSLFLTVRNNAYWNN